MQSLNPQTFISRSERIPSVSLVAWVVRPAMMLVAIVVLVDWVIFESSNKLD